MDKKRVIVDGVRQFVDYVMDAEEKCGDESVEFVAIVQSKKDGLIAWNLFSSVNPLKAADMMKGMSDLTYTEVLDDSPGSPENDSNDVR